MRQTETTHRHYTEIEYTAKRSYRHYGKDEWEVGNVVEGHMEWQPINGSLIPASVIHVAAQNVGKQ